MISLCGVPGPHFCFWDAKLSFTNRLYWLGALTLACVPSALKRPKACNCPLHALQTCQKITTFVTPCEVSASKQDEVTLTPYG